jgi:hypothetical protein
MGYMIKQTQTSDQFILQLLDNDFYFSCTGVVLVGIQKRFEIYRGDMSIGFTGGRLAQAYLVIHQLPIRGRDAPHLAELGKCHTKF